MRNLKRVLALAMAMVMILGMMVIGSSAASYSDAAAIDEDYAVAVEVLSGMGVFKGTGAGFAPKQILTRAEAATLIYRVITGDVKDAQTQNYDYASLKDIQAGQWYTGYVTYANNGGYIKGDDLGNFNPYQQVTGIQVMAIMLRAAGYGQNGEYEGTAWKDNILTDGFELGITGDISTATLNAPATRELVAQLIFNAITSVKMVSYAPLLGYYKAADAQTLAEKVFALTSVEAEDDWGRPATIWYNVKKGVAKGTYATIAAEPVATFNVATSECDIAEALGMKKAGKVTFYFDGKPVDKTVTPTAVNSKIGAQGRLIEVYDDEHVVVISTYLAQVTKVVPEKTDAKGHVYYDAYSTVKVWAPAGLTIKDTDIAGNDYAKDAYILVYYNEVTEELEAVQEADSFVGAQTKIWYNASKRTIDDTNYFQAENYVKDAAGYDDAKYTWFVDLYGNVIGSAEIAANYNYAVLKDMIWTKGVGAEATLVYMDGSEETVTVATIDGEWATDWAIDNNVTKLDDQALVDNSWGGVSTEARYNNEYLGAALYKITYNKNGTVGLQGIVAGDTVVYYSDEAVIDTSASVILDTDNSGKLYITTQTQFLVREGTERTGYTYEVYDIDTLPEYAADAAEIFYTVGKNGLVDRVYIKWAALEADFGTHLFTTTSSYYRVAGSLEDWTMTVLVDGVEREIVTNWDNIQILKANKGKLFHVEWVDSPYTDIYGYVDQVRLVNNAEEDGGNFYGCNYLAGDITVTVSSIINEGASYRTDANTVVYGDIDSIDELTQDVADQKGIWVIADATTSYSRAKAIYVGTKLNESTKITVAYDDANIASAKVEGNKITVTLVVDKTTCDFAVIGANANTVLNGDLGATACDENTTSVEVYNEAANDSAEYTVEIVTSESKATSEITITNVIMDAEAGCSVTFTATRSDGIEIFASRFTVELYNANGSKVYTENSVQATDGTNEYEATLGYELTQGAEYYVVVTASNLNNCEGSTATSDLYEATVEV